MINEEKIILMTHLAVYEKGEGKRTMSVGKYFRGDYISLHLLRTVLSGTFAFLIGLGVYLLYFYEDILMNLYTIDFAALAKNVIAYYVGFLVIYGLLTYIVFTVRFIKAKKSIRGYYQNLKKLNMKRNYIV